MISGERWLCAYNAQYKCVTYMVQSIQNERRQNGRRKAQTKNRGRNIKIEKALMWDRRSLDRELTRSDFSHKSYCDYWMRIDSVEHLSCYLIVICLFISNILSLWMQNLDIVYCNVFMIQQIKSHIFTELFHYI